MKYRTKKKKSQATDLLNADPLYFNEKTITRVVAYQGTIIYFLYKDDGIFCRIYVILAMRR